MNKKIIFKKLNILTLAATLSLGLAGCGSQTTSYIINVSYDPTREFYESYNQLFMDHMSGQLPEDFDIIQSHGGSGKQALEVANGLEADVVTLALEEDITSIAETGLIDAGFTSEFDDDSAPYTSTIVFLVRKDDPKAIYDWDDLLRDDVGVITPNPQTSGGARWNYLAAWYYFEQAGYSYDEIVAAMKLLYSHVVVLDSGARASTTSFVENGQGDVLLAWENEAFLCMEEYPDQYEIVIPSTSILCQPTVALVDEMVDKHGSREIATEYLSYLYSTEAQELIGQNYYRPVDKAVAAEFIYSGDSRTITSIPADGRWLLEDIDLTDINHFGGWDEATAEHFADGGIFDSIYE